MRKSFALLCAFLLCGWTPSPPTGVQTLFSQSYQMTGTCTGSEMVYSWSVNGAPPGNGSPPPAGQNGASFIYPWVSSDITIHGAELTVLSPGVTYWWFMIGNNADGDTMLFMSSDKKRETNWYPQGTGFQFPSTSDGDSTTYMDLHGGCPAGQSIALMMTLYYTINGS